MFSLETVLGDGENRSGKLLVRLRTSLYADKSIDTPNINVVQGRHLDLTSKGSLVGDTSAN